MKSEPITELIRIQLTLEAVDARGLYAELYRLSADKLMQPYPEDSYLGELMRSLARAGADQ